MRIVVDLPDELLNHAISRAALDGMSTEEFVVAAVQQRLEPPKKGRRSPPVIGGKDGPPIPDLTREQIDEAMFG